MLASMGKNFGTEQKRPRWPGGRVEEVAAWAGLTVTVYLSVCHNVENFQSFVKLMYFNLQFLNSVQVVLFLMLV